jgi:hypothetical protein
MILHGSYESPSDLVTSLGPSKYFAYQLTGRFGNQLLGVSEANLIARITGRRVVFTAKLAEERLLWMSQLANSDWFDIFVGSFASIPSVKPAFENREKHRDFITSQLFFSGFTQDYKVVESSGFLKQELLFESLEALEPPDIAISVRLGDYRKNPHLGVLPIRYYKRALQHLDLKATNKSFVKIYVDNIADVSPVQTSWIGQFGPVIHSSNFMRDWQEIAQAKMAIASNSTFSYTARLNKTSSTIFPKPFYLGQEQKLLPDDGLIVNYTRFPRIHYAAQYFSSHLR